jgi:hypothetical protein
MTNILTFCRDFFIYFYLKYILPFTCNMSLWVLIILGICSIFWSSLHEAVYEKHELFQTRLYKYKLKKLTYFKGQPHFSH